MGTQIAGSKVFEFKWFVISKNKLFPKFYLINIISKFNLLLNAKKLLSYK